MGLIGEEHLRVGCATSLVALDLPGYAIGGVSVGEGHELGHAVGDEDHGNGELARHDEPGVLRQEGADVVVSDLGELSPPAEGG